MSDIILGVRQGAAPDALAKRIPAVATAGSGFGQGQPFRAVRWLSMVVPGHAGSDWGWPARSTMDASLDAYNPTLAAALSTNKLPRLM